MFLQKEVEKEEVNRLFQITLLISCSSNFLTFILSLLCPSDCGRNRCCGSCGGRVVGRSAFEFFGLQLCVDPHALQSLRGEIPLQHRRLLVTVVQAERYVPVGGGPRSTQVDQAQFVSVRVICLVLLVHLLLATFKMLIINIYRQ